MSNLEKVNENDQLEIDSSIDNLIKENTHLLDIIQKIVVNMFKRYKDNLSNKSIGSNQAIDEQKLILSKFEKVMKCLRYLNTSNKDFYKKVDEDLELLVQLSEVNSISIAMKELTEEYLRVYKIDTLKINTYKENNTDNEKFTNWLKHIGIDLTLKEETLPDGK
jgi:hypothetical protein